MYTMDSVRVNWPMNKASTISGGQREPLQAADEPVRNEFIWNLLLWHWLKSITIALQCKISSNRFSYSIKHLNFSATSTL